jgi:hypothetical protein
VISWVTRNPATIEAGLVRPFGGLRKSQVNDISVNKELGTYSRLPGPEDPTLSSVLESLGLGIPEVSQERLVFTGRVEYQSSPQANF